LNLTTHNVSLYLTDHSIVDIPAREGEPARITVRQQSADVVGLPVPVVVEHEVGSEGVPPQRPDVLWIVAERVRRAHADRQDLASPTNLVRDEHNRVVGCRALAINPGRGPAELV
jgi:hypothetical protein